MGVSNEDQIFLALIIVTAIVGILGLYIFFGKKK